MAVAEAVFLLEPGDEHAVPERAVFWWMRSIQ